MPLWQPAKALSRPVYYDRDPVPEFAYWINAVAPHGVTLRATYGPATGRAAFLERFTLQAFRTTVAAPAADVNHWANFNPFYGGAFRFAYVVFSSNTLYVVNDDNGSDFGYMAFGDDIEIYSLDNSTGGSVAYLGSVKCTDFLY